MNNWYVAQTHALSEQKALFNLRRQGYNVYLPKYLKKRSHAGLTDWVSRPLFPCYLFIELDVDTVLWHSIRSTIGVSKFICSGDRPSPVPDGIVEAIIGREDENGHVGLSRNELFKKGQAVEISDGPMVDTSVIFECVDDRDRVIVLMDLLGRQVRVSVPLEAVKASA